MKNQSLFVVALFLSLSVFSQQTRFFSDPGATFKEAKEYFQKEQLLFYLQAEAAQAVCLYMV